jgi:hypothetical protein
VKRALLTAAAIVAAVVVFILATLPRARVELAPFTGTGDGTVAGVIHVHTNRSDGRSSPD